jgi:SPP1 gp7 family putative phage head morphogenesis protein
MTKLDEINKLPYWERRRVLNEAKVQHKAIDVGQTIQKAYANAKAKLEADITRIYNRAKRVTGYDEKTLAAALKEEVTSTTLAEMADLLAQTEDPLIKQEMKAKLNAQAYKHRITQLDALRAKANLTAGNVASVEKLKTEELLTETVRDAYVEGQGEIIATQAVEGNLEWTTDSSKGIPIRTWQGEEYFLKVDDMKEQLKELPVKDVQNVLDMHWKGDNYSGRVWKDNLENDQRDALAQRLEELFTEKNFGSMSQDEMIKAVAHEFDKSTGVAARLIRTESNYVFNQGILKGWIAKRPNAEYRFVAIIDERTSWYCKEQEGKIYKVADAKVNVNYPPMHPWCRSTVALWFGDGEINPNKTVRDPVTGEAIKVPKDALYDDIMNELYKHSSKEEVEMAYEKKANRVADTQRLREMTRIMGEEHVPSLEDFQEWKYNDSEEYAQLKRAEHTVKTIKNKPDPPFGEEYKDRIISNYWKFRDDGHELSQYGANKYSQRIQEGFGDTPVSYEDVLGVMNRQPDYMDISNPAKAMDIWHDETTGLELMRDRNTNEFNHFLVKDKLNKKERWEEWK